MDNQKMTEAEFAKAVGASPSTVGRLRRARKIDYHRYGRMVYYLPEDIEAWHKTMKHEAIWPKNHDLRKAS
jgi:DNA-binding MurR/RpiR family transcriptional regulator